MSRRLLCLRLACAPLTQIFTYKQIVKEPRSSFDARSPRFNSCILPVLAVSSSNCIDMRSRKDRRTSAVDKDYVHLVSDALAKHTGDRRSNSSRPRGSAG